MGFISCKKSNNTLEEDPTLTGTEWVASTADLNMTLRFLTDSTCGILASANNNTFSANYTSYTYKRGYGIDLVLFEAANVSYTVNFLDKNTLRLNQSLDNQVSENFFILKKVIK